MRNVWTDEVKDCGYVPQCICSEIPLKIPYRPFEKSFFRFLVKEERVGLPKSYYGWCGKEECKNMIIFRNI